MRVQWTVTDVVLRYEQPKDELVGGSGFDSCPSVLKERREMPDYDPYCARCGKLILDGRDEEQCLLCRATLCLECCWSEFVCPACEEEEERKHGQG